jgi:hypothetical protein
MPWGSGKEFAGRHNSKLHGKAARGTKDVANKLLSEGKPEGQAIREANAVGDRLMGRNKPKERTQRQKMLYDRLRR